MRVKSNGNYRREERSPPRSHPVQLNFKNHCLFCLEPQPPSTVLEIVQDNPKKLRSFQPVLHYLTGTDPTYDKSAEECEVMGIPAMGNLPPMCPSCYDAMAELYRLHEQLLNIQFLIQEQTQLARQTVPLRSQSSSRQQFFARIQSSGLSVEEVAAVRKFVDNLHNKIIEEVSDKKKVIFPARAPPNFFPNPERSLPSTSSSATDYPPDYTATSSTASSENPNPRSNDENVSSPCSVLRNAEVVMLPSVVETDDIKYENEYGDEEDMSEPDMIIPDKDMDIISEQPPSDSTRDTPSRVAESRTRLSQRIMYRKEPSFEPSRSLTSVIRRRRKASVAGGKFRKGAEGLLDKIPRRRPRNIRKIINGISTYVAQYCDLCNKLLPASDIRNHLEDVHNLKGYVVECPSPRCPYVFSCRAKMEKHLRTQNPHKCQMAASLPAGSLIKTCETCDFKTSSATALRNHLQRHESSMPEKSVCCPIEGCAERCALRQSIEYHINFHELRPPKTEQECSVCNELLKIEDLTEHLIETHNIDEPVPCKRCPFIFHDWESLLDHLYEHYSPGGLSCDICDNGIMIEKYDFLLQHYFSFHEIGKEFLCEHCDKSFYVQTTLSSHKKRYHSKDPTNPEPVFSPKKSSFHRGNIKYENEFGNQDEEEMQEQEPDMILPDFDEISEQSSHSGSNTPSHSPVAESRTRVSPRIKYKSRPSFEPSRSLTSILRQRKSVTAAVRKTRNFGIGRSTEKDVEGVSGKITRQRRRCRDVRKIINGVSTYVAQYCDLCNKLLSASDIREHLEDTHNLKGYIVECPSPRCPYLFSCRGKMEKHLRTQNPHKCQMAANLPAGSLVKKCETCDFKASSATAFRNHLQRHESSLPEKTVCCPIEGCAERCALRQSVEDHINFHELLPPKTEQECSVCTELIKIEDATEHLKEFHKIDEPVPCRRCPFIFHDWESLLDHLYEHYSPGGLSCDICDNGIRIEKFESLLQHYFSAHEVGKQLICEHCNKAFYTQAMLSSHNKRNHSNDKKDRTKKKLEKVKCELCPEPVFLSTKEAMRSHNIRFHDGDPFPCKFCDRAFITVHSLKRHQIEHTGSAREYKCSVEGCGRVFQNRTLVRYHELGRHSETQPFVCDICGKKFNYQSGLKAHVDLMHLGRTRKCVCETCGRTLASKKSLKTHMLVHTVARPHACHICNQTFRHLEAMRTHVRAHEEKGENFRPKGPRSK